MVAIYIVGIAIAAFSLFSGFRSKEMSAMGVPYGNWHRIDNPGMFWFAAGFNLLILLAGVTLLFAEAGP
jgi:hypothetical protein